MESLSVPPVVSTDWLAGRLGDPLLAILDASWHLPTSGRDARAEFLAAHLPGARFFDLDEVSDLRSPLPHMMPTADQFGAAAGRLGIGNDTTVVVYDGSGANMSAARVWWMFRTFGHDRVTVLDGGSGKWRAEGRPLERGEPTPPACRFVTRLSPGRTRTSAEVAAALSDGSAQVVDARSADRFAGAAPEPRPGIPSGHMPGALSLPYSDLVRGDGTVLDPAALRERLIAAGIRFDRPVIATCGSGVSACTILHALHRLGHDTATLYDGAWTEWAGTGMPVEGGDR
jgi:thiosulfate/3-mercaptopyruvate sulfurtransferase